MKKLYLILLLGAVAPAWAGNPPTPTLSQTNRTSPAREKRQTNAVPQIDLKSTTQIESHAWETPPLSLESPAPNGTAHGRVTVDGILVQAATTDNPLELINPAAPESYGSPEDNVVRDPASGKVSGLKFLELRF